jgi:rod shape-determining protein MreD
MIKSIVFSTIAIAFFATLQSTILQHIAILNVTPDLALLVLLLVSLRNGSMVGQFSGFFAGFVQDFISSAPLGFHSLINVVVGFLYGIFKGNFFIDKILVPVVIALTGTLLKALLSNILGWLFPSAIPSYSFVSVRFWVEAGYNTVLSPLVFLLIGFIRPLFIVERKI